MTHTRFFRLVNWWEHRHVEHIGWRDNTDSTATATAAAATTTAAQTSVSSLETAYVQSYRIYTENTEIPNSPKAPQITVNNNFHQGAFDGATCCFEDRAQIGDRAIPLSVQEPDRGTRVYSKSPSATKASAVPDSPSSDESLSLSDNVAALVLPDGDESPARQVRLSDVTKGTDSSYEDSEADDLSFTEEEFDDEEFVVIKDHYSFQTDDDVVHVLGLDVATNTVKALTLTKTEYKEALEPDTLVRLQQDEAIVYFEKKKEAQA